MNLPDYFNSPASRIRTKVAGGMFIMSRSQYLVAQVVLLLSLLSLFIATYFVDFSNFLGGYARLAIVTFAVLELAEMIYTMRKFHLVYSDLHVLNKDSVFYKQENIRTSVSFDFKKDELIFSLKDSSTNTVTAIPYLQITSESTDFTEKNDWYRNVGIIWIVIGAIFEIPALLNGTPKLPIWSGLGLLMLLIYMATKKRYTILHTATRSNIVILHDEQHNAIVKQIRDTRREKFKEKLGDINIHNDPELEKQKFEFLFKEDVISAQERDNAIAQIDKLTNERGTPSPFQ